MTLLPIAIVVAIVLVAAYRIYGGLLTRLFALDPHVPTPAVAERDDNDFVPIEPKFLMGQHFSAIAAAGPIVGPILAGIAFGWVPALLWILVGAVFIGGVHDFSALVASIRHRARSIAEVVREHVSRRAFLLFLGFIWIALVYIIVAFADITAQAFVADQRLEDGQTVIGAGIATSSALYLLIPLAMGFALRFTRLKLLPATLIFLPLVLAAIYFGQQFPLDFRAWFGLDAAGAQRLWGLIILGYCVLAAMAPMWLLLQPRGHLGGYFLYGCLAVGVVGVLFLGREVKYPAFTGWEAGGQTLAPFLFITIACGAVSGFHALIASGTTSKQLHRETDARPVGYGTMLLEAGVAFIALACVMMLAKGDARLAGSPNAVFAGGIASFLTPFGIPAAFAFAIVMMAFTTFVYDTLDVCTRLGRYILQELTGWSSRAGMWFGAAVTALAPVPFLAQQAVDAAGKPIPAWRVFWPLFGASNQLLAALTLLGITVWLWRTRRQAWVWLVTGLPCAFMYAMSCWALGSILLGAIKGGRPTLVFWVAAVLMVLALWMLVEAVAMLRKPAPPVTPQPAPA